MRLGRVWGFALTLAVIGLVSAAPAALAAGDVEAYTLNISPRNVAGGSVTPFTFALKNDRDNFDALSAAQFTAPTGFTVTKAALPSGAPGRASVSGNVVTLTSLRLAPGSILNVSVTATAPSSCTKSSYAWGSAASEGSTPTNNERLSLTASASSVTTDVSTPCALRFVIQPHSATVGQPITGTDFSPSGPPVTVDVVDGAGNVITTSSAPVTVALGNNPGSATLSGTKTVSAVNGVASFSGLALDQPANGYTLTTASPSLAGASSNSFDEQSQAVPCSENQTCQTDVANSGGDLQVVANPDPTKPDQGTLTESVNAYGAKQLVCAGYTSADPNTYEFYVTSQNRSKVLTQTIKQPAIPLSGTTAAILNTQQDCYGAPYEFITSSGSPAAVGTLPDGSSGYIGLLPNCGSAGATVCIASRSSRPDLSNGLGFDITLTIDVPAGLQGDPYSH